MQTTSPPFRKWPINTSLDKIIVEFGVDVTVYFKFIHDLLIIFSLLFFANTINIVAYTILDFAPRSILFSHNLYNFCQSYAYSAGIAVTQVFCLFLCVIFLCYLTLSNRAIARQESKKILAVDDYSLLVNGFPMFVSNIDIEKYFSSVVDSLFEDGTLPPALRAALSRAEPHTLQQQTFAINSIASKASLGGASQNFIYLPRTLSMHSGLSRASGDQASEAGTETGTGTGTGAGANPDARPPATSVRATAVDTIQTAASTTGSVYIANILRISDPRSMMFRKQFATLQSELYAKISDAVDDFVIMYLRRPFLRRLLDFFHLTWAFQSAYGLWRDPDFYRHDLTWFKAQILKADRRVTRKTNKRTCLDNLSYVRDAAIITFESAVVKDKVLRALGPRARRGPGPARLLNKYAIHVCQAPSPRDIHWDNLWTNPTIRFFRSLLSYLVSLFISAVLFLCVCLLRSVQKNYRVDSNSWYIEQLLTIVIYGVIYGFDQALRPAIWYLIVYEGHQSFSSFETSLYVKFFLYQLLNKLTPLYSRSMLAFFFPKVFPPSEALFAYKESSAINPGLAFNVDSIAKGNPLNIVSFLRSWRVGGDSPGRDLLYLMGFEIVLYNLSDLLYFTIFRFVVDKASLTAFDRRMAETRVQARYAYFYTNLMCVFTLCTAFMYAQPVILPMAVAYLVIHNYIMRFLVFRKAAPPPRFGGSMSRLTEILVAAALYFAVCVLSQGYLYTNTMYAYMIMAAGAVTVLLLVLNPHTVVCCLARFRWFQRSGIAILQDKDALLADRKRAELPFFRDTGLSGYDPEVGSRLTDKEVIGLNYLLAHTEEKYCVRKGRIMVARDSAEAQPRRRRGGADAPPPHPNPVVTAQVAQREIAKNAASINELVMRGKARGGAGTNVAYIPIAEESLEDLSGADVTPDDRFASGRKRGRKAKRPPGAGGLGTMRARLARQRPARPAEDSDTWSSSSS